MRQAPSIPAPVKKEISRLRSEVRKLHQQKDAQTQKAVQPFSGAIFGNYWSQTGMPWASSDGRKAVMTEWFWQPIRGQPRRVDTTELRSFSQTFWINSCVNTIIDEVTTIDWDVITKDGIENEDVKEEIEKVKNFLDTPNSNSESLQDILRALIKDILEIDAGVLVKVFDVQSYDFDQLEPRSGAPLLKPKGQRRLTEIYSRDGASFLADTDKFGYAYGYWQYSYQIPAHPMWFSKPEICYIKKFNRSMSPYGFSAVQAVLDIVKSLHYSTQYNKRFFEETPLPSGIISADGTNEQDMKALASQWNSDFKAQPHKLLFATSEIKWQPLSATNQELEFIETQSWYYKMVISAFGLTPTELGMTEDANRATASTQAEVTRRRAVRPLILLIENAINKEIIPEITNAPVQFSFIVDDPAEKNQRLVNWKQELDMGIKTINDVRAEMGLKDVNWGEIPLTHQQANPNQQDGTMESETNEQANQEISQDDKKTHTENTHTSQTQEAHLREEERKIKTQDPYDSAKRPVGSFR